MNCDGAMNVGKSINEAGPEPDDILDATGLHCPEPLMLLHNKIHDIQSQQILKVLATDSSTLRDIPKFCSFLGHELLSQSEDDGVFCYFIRRG